jgi:vacuolar protein-sorting-associated protein 4
MNHDKFLISVFKQKAVVDRYEKKGDYKKAKECLTRLLEQMIVYHSQMKDDLCPEIHISKLRKVIETFMEKAEELKLYCDDKEPSLVSKKHDTPMENSSRSDQTPQKEDEKSISEYGDLEDYSGKRGTATLDDVIGNQSVKNIFVSAFQMRMQQPQIFKSSKMSSSLLLYGPPGTGKTLIARAVANTYNCTYMEISSAEILSKWLGNSEKRVKRMFDLAVKNAPTLIFIDECDQLLGKRKEGENDNRRVKTQFMTAINDTLNLDGVLVFIVAATNIPTSLDAAIHSRFRQTAHFRLPNIQERGQMIRKGLQDHPYVSDSAIDDIARKTQDYSGRNIYHLCQNAEECHINRLQSATHFRRNDNGMYEVTDATDKQGIEMPWTDVPPGKIEYGPMDDKSLYNAFSLFKPDIDQQMIRANMEFEKII